MADKYAVAKSRLDGLAASIQRLNGVATGLTPKQMQEQLDIANAEVEEQAALIAEISNILATKAGGSGGGGALETCTLNVGYPDAPLDDGMAYLYATGADMSLLEIDLNKPIEYQILKNSIVTSTTSMISASGEYTSLGNYTFSAFVTGDMSVTYRG